MGRADPDGRRVEMGTAAGHLPEDHHSFEDYLELEERTDAPGTHGGFGAVTAGADVCTMRRVHR